MRPARLVLAAALLLPLGGCVLAVGEGENEGLRDRVRDLERRVDRMERPGMPEPMHPGMHVPMFRSGEFHPAPPGREPPPPMEPPPPIEKEDR